MHVAAVAEGLAALGHDVTALVTPGPRRARPSAVRWVPMAPPLGAHASALARARRDRAARARHPARRDHRAVPQLRRRGDPSAAGAERRGGARSQRAGRSIIPGSPKALLDRALLVAADAALARAPLPRWPTSSSRRTPRSCRLDIPREQDPRARVGRRHRALPPRRRGRSRRYARPGVTRSRSSPARSAPGTARSTWPRRSRRCASAADKRYRRRVHRRRPGAAARRARPPTGSTRSSSPARCRTTGCRRRSPAPTSASRRSTSARTRRCRSGSTGRR